MRKQNFYQKAGATFAFNPWDLLALVIILLLFLLLAFGANEMSRPFNVGQTLQLSLDPRYLPVYGLQSVLRMLIAMLFSLVFTFVVGTLAARNRHAERIIIPFIDILQSVPVLGYLSITVAGFIAIFPGSLWGPEACCIFVIFTAQVWNMTLGFYQSLKTVPDDIIEAARMFNLNPWQRFWRIDVAFALPGLLWNMMMSMSQSWVFLMFSEAIQVARQNIQLPGIGSYIFNAIETANIHAILYALGAMFIIIFLYDQLMFRPLLKWAGKFRFDKMLDEKPSRVWFTSLLQRSQLSHYLGEFFSYVGNAIINIRFGRGNYQEQHRKETRWNKIIIIGFYMVLLAVLIVAIIEFYRFIFSTLGWRDLWHVVLLSMATAARVLATIAISSLIWVPIGVAIGRNPRLSKLAQPIVQFCAAFPANLIYPLVVIIILRWNLSINIWSTGLLVMGAQWYILFNVIAGTSMIPKEIHYVAKNFDVRGNLWWRRILVPAIFPYYVTGAITAAGGAWNLAIVAEAVSWGQHKFLAFGVGAYIEQSTMSGDFHRVALGIGVMILFVLLLNWLIWRPLYNLTEQRLRAQ